MKYCKKHNQYYFEFWACSECNKNNYKIVTEDVALISGGITLSDVNYWQDELKKLRPLSWAQILKRGLENENL